MTATVHGPTRHPVAIATGGFLALAIAIGIGRFVYTPVLPYMVAGLGLTKSDAGLIASANFLGYLVGALLAARSTLPGSRRLWLLSALAVSTATTAAMAIDGSLALFLFLRLSGGIASAVVMVFASALVMDHLAAANRPAWAALLYAGVGGGIVISAMMISMVATSDADWVPLWLASGLLSLALFIIACWLLAGSDPRAAGEPPAAPVATSGPRTRSGFRRWVVAYGLFGFGYVITATFIADLVRASPALRPAEPLVWLMVGLAAMPSVTLWTLMARRWGNGRVFATACLLEAAGVALSVVSENIGAILAAAGLLGGTFMGLTALGLMEIRQLSPDNPRRGLAMMTASFGLGQMIGPALAGDLHDRLGSYLLPSLLAAAALLIAAASTAAAAPSRRL